jgi:hypothetical protein
MVNGAFIELEGTLFCHRQPLLRLGRTADQVGIFFDRQRAPFFGG